MKKTINYFRYLIEDTKGQLSMGRVAFWVVFCISMKGLWFTGDLSGNVIGLLTSLLAYSIGKYYVRGKFSNGNGNSEEEKL